MLQRLHINKRLSCQRCWHDREGGALIEFAFLAPILLLMVFGTVEMALVMYVQSVMEGATTISARLGKTGYSESGISREQTIRNMRYEHANDFIDPSYFGVEAKTYGQFDQIGDQEPFMDSNGNSVYDGGEAYTDSNGNGAYDTGEPYADADGNGSRNAGETYSDVNGNGQWDADMGQAGYGDANDIVVYTVTYPWRISTPLIARLVGDGNGTVTLRAAAVVKNEPY